MSLSPRLFALAFALCSLSAASPGWAAGKRHAAAGRAAAPSFPMKSDEYKELIEKRIDKVRAVVDKKLDRAGVSADRKKAIHKIIDEEAKDLRAEVAKATADGSVTEAEAGKVKVLTNGLRARVRERMRAEKNPKAKATLDAIRAKEAKEKSDKDKSEQAAKKKAVEGKAQQAVTEAKEKAAKDKAGKDKAAKEALAKATRAAKAKANKPAVSTKPAKAKAPKASAAKKKKKSAPSPSPTSAAL
jgi:colicin import membrane protein